MRRVLLIISEPDSANKIIYGGALLLGRWQLHPLVILFALSGSLMISKTLRIPKL